MGSFPVTVTVTTMGYRSYKNPLNKAPLRTVTGRGNDSRFRILPPNNRGASKKFSIIPYYPPTSTRRLELHMDPPSRA